MFAISKPIVIHWLNDALFDLTTNSPRLGN
jgi:hypothetical protein